MVAGEDRLSHRSNNCLFHGVFQSVHLRLDLDGKVDCLLFIRLLARWISSADVRRMLLAQYPHSRNLITVKRAYMCIGLSYTLAIFWVILPLLGWSSYDFEVDEERPKRWIGSHVLFQFRARECRVQSNGKSNRGSSPVIS